MNNHTVPSSPHQPPASPWKYQGLLRTVPQPHISYKEKQAVVAGETLIIIENPTLEEEGWGKETKVRVEKV